MLGGDRTGGLGGGHGGEQRRQRLASQSATRAEVSGGADPGPGLAGGQPQQVAQQPGGVAGAELVGHRPRVELGDQPVPDRGQPPGLDLDAADDVQQLVAA